MRSLRIATLGTIALLALAGGAAAFVNLHASHSTTADDASLSGDHGLDASRDGLTLGTGLAGDHASATGGLDATLPALDVPATPSLPDAPTVPALAVPEAPELPATPSAGATAGADASAESEHGSASGSALGGVTVG